MRLGVAEPAVEFEDHGAACGDHEPAIEDTLVFRTFGFHAGNDRTRDVSQEPVAHLVIDDCRGSIGAHSSRIETGVAVANAFVVLRRDERCDSLAVAHNEE